VSDDPITTPPTSPEPFDPIAELRRIESTVRRLLPRYYDHESLAVDILIESHLKGYDHPTTTFIRNRCYDAANHETTEQRARIKSQMFADQHHNSSEPEDADDDSANRADVSDLIKVLGPLERKLIFYRFYLDLPIAEIARRLELNVNVVREQLTQALYKMRQEA